MWLSIASSIRMPWQTFWIDRNTHATLWPLLMLDTISSWVAIQRRVIIGHPQNASQSLSFRVYRAQNTFWYAANANITNDTAYLLWCFVHVHSELKKMEENKMNGIGRWFKFMYWFSLHCIQSNGNGAKVMRSFLFFSLWRCVHLCGVCLSFWLQVCCH